MCRGLGSLVGLALVAALAAGCVGPARSTPDYLQDMVNSAEVVVSALETARMTVDAVAQRRSTAAYASLQLSESSTDIESVITTFSSVQPPSPELDAARADLISAMQSASGLVGDLRLTAFRNDFHRLPAIAEDIAEVREHLKQIVRSAAA